MALRLWEEELMIELRMTEADYVTISKKERARKIVAMKLKDWFSMLEYQLQKKELDKK